MTLAAIEAPEIRMVKQAPFEVQAALEHLDSVVRQGYLALDLNLHGRLELVFFEQRLKRGESRIGKGKIDWRTQGPKVALSRDQSQVLFLEPLRQELPHLPQTDAKGNTVRNAKNETLLRPQLWEELGPVILEGRDRDFLVYRNVRQIVIRNNAGFYVNIKCSIGPFDSFTSLLVSPQDGAAYFLGGRITIEGLK